VPDYYDQVVLALLSIIRNLALIVANEDVLAYQPRLLHHLVSLIPCWKSEVSFGIRHHYSVVIIPFH